MTLADARKRGTKFHTQRLFAARLDQCGCQITFSGYSTGQAEQWGFRFPGGAEVRCPHGNVMTFDAREPDERM